MTRDERIPDYYLPAPTDRQRENTKHMIMESRMTTRYEYLNGQQIQIVKMAFGNTTKEGPYYAKVDGENIGINGRTHWESEAAARLAAETHIHAVNPTRDSETP
jgi:hypothetical protein